jgi:hypothetical protein
MMEFAGFASVASGWDICGATMHFHLGEHLVLDDVYR